MRRTYSDVGFLRVVAGLSLIVALILLIMLFHDHHSGGWFAFAFDGVFYPLIGGFAILGLILLLITETEKTDNGAEQGPNTKVDKEQ